MLCPSRPWLSARLKAVFSKEVNIVIVGQDQIGVEPLVPHALLCAKKTTLVKQCVRPPLVKHCTEAIPYGVPSSLRHVLATGTVFPLKL